MIQQYLNEYKNRFVVYAANAVFQQKKASASVAVVIPCFDEPNVLSTVASLQNCIFPGQEVLVVWVVNHGENASQEAILQNQKSVELIRSASEDSPAWLNTHILLQANMPKKHAGVGLARKIGMDYACEWMADKEEGLIICYDADSQCDTNYLQAVIQHFKETQFNACAIHFEHPLEGKEFSASTYYSILLYELHLRYYRQAQKYTGHPFAYHTVGSSMAVKASAYLKQGGMNKRKAGEDFYFLAKMMLLGDFEEVNTTRVIPSPRSSHRVPFGTGKAVGELLEKETIQLTSYSFALFQILKAFFEAVNSNSFVAADGVLADFLAQEKWEAKWHELVKQTTNEAAFIKRFYTWFDLFKIMKFLHYARANGYPDEDVLHTASALLSELQKLSASWTPKELLLTYREMDKTGGL